jgi:hypothetical protein
MTSEQYLGLPDQPGPICYHIDFGVVPSIQSGQLDRALGDLEILRAEVIRLRAWGQAWKDFARLNKPHKEAKA